MGTEDFSFGEGSVRSSGERWKKEMLESISQKGDGGREDERIGFVESPSEVVEHHSEEES